MSSSVGGTAPPSAIGIPGHDEDEGERDVGEIYYTGANNNSNSSGSCQNNGSLPDKDAPSIGTCRALYDYTANMYDELSIRTGDVINIHDKQADGWWLGELKGTVGIFPATYVEENYWKLFGLKSTHLCPIVGMQFIV